MRARAGGPRARRSGDRGRGAARVPVRRRRLRRGPDRRRLQRDHAHEFLPEALPRAWPRGARRDRGRPREGVQREVRQAGHGQHAAGARRRAVRLRARHLALHRLPPLRLRLRQGEQPEPRSADPLDPRAGDGQGEGHRPRARQRLLRRGDGAAAGPLLPARRLPAVRQPALREELPGRRDLEGARRHRRDRLRLVHRLPLLHVGLPLRRAALQLDRRPRCRPRRSTPRCTTSATARA